MSKNVMICGREHVTPAGKFAWEMHYCHKSPGHKEKKHVCSCKLAWRSKL